MGNLVNNTVKQTGRDEKEVWDSYNKIILLGRLQEPKDVRDAALFLSSDLAKNITAQPLNVCGGYRFN